MAFFGLSQTPGVNPAVSRTRGGKSSHRTASGTTTRSRIIPAPRLRTDSEQTVAGCLKRAGIVFAVEPDAFLLGQTEREGIMRPDFRLDNGVFEGVYLEVTQGNESKVREKLARIRRLREHNRGVRVILIDGSDCERLSRDRVSIENLITSKLGAQRPV